MQALPAADYLGHQRAVMRCLRALAHFAVHRDLESAGRISGHDAASEAAWRCLWAQLPDPLRRGLCSTVLHGAPSRGLIQLVSAVPAVMRSELIAAAAEPTGHLDATAHDESPTLSSLYALEQSLQAVRPVCLAMTLPRTQGDGASVWRALSACTQVTSLHLHRLANSHGSMAALAQALPHFAQLSAVKLQMVSSKLAAPKPASWDSLAGSIARATALQQLHIVFPGRRNPSDGDGSQAPEHAALVKSIGSLTRLTEIALDRCCAPLQVARGCKEIASSLRSIELSAARYESVDAERAMIAAFALCWRLEAFSISWTRMRDKQDSGTSAALPLRVLTGLTHLAVAEHSQRAALSHVASATQLERLRWEVWSTERPVNSAPRSCDGFVHACPQLQHLTALSLGIDPDLTADARAPEWVSEVASVLAQLSRLQELRVSSCGVFADPVCTLPECFVTAALQLPQLRTLCTGASCALGWLPLWECSAPALAAGVQGLAQALPALRTLRELDATLAHQQGASAGPNTHVRVAHVLRACSALTRLHLRHDGPAPPGALPAAELFGALPASPLLQSLAIEHLCDFGAPQASECSAGLRRMQQLTSVSFDISSSVDWNDALGCVVALPALQQLRLQHVPDRSSNVKQQRQQSTQALRAFASQLAQPGACPAMQHVHISVRHFRAACWPVMLQRAATADLQRIVSWAKQHAGLVVLQIPWPFEDYALLSSLAEEGFCTVCNTGDGSQLPTWQRGSTPDM